MAGLTGRVLFYGHCMATNTHANGIPVKTTLLSVARTATNLLFPPRCVHCGTDGSLFCDTCETASTRLRPDETCRTCALPSPTSTCEICFAEPPALNRAVAVFTYQPEIRDAIAALKYKDIRTIAPRLGTLMAEIMPDPSRNQVDALVPVPVSRPRMRSRGYNQSELLTRRIAAINDIEIRSGLLIRSIDHGPQARAGSLEERAENVTGAFSVNGNVDGLRIMLIDDVMTTGATLNSCAKALNNSGASWVGSLVLAREI